MTGGEGSPWGSNLARKRGARLALLAAVLLVLAAIGPLHRALAKGLAVAGPLFVAHPVAGAALFVGLAAASAMLTFFSSAVLVPGALAAWSPAICALLLWAGWILGGVLAYVIARYLARPAVKTLSAKVLGQYEGLLARGVSFGTVLLFQLAVPSEIPGYAFGLAKVRFPLFLAGLALAELPYAIATATAGSAFMERRLVPLGLSIALSATLGLLAFRTLRRNLARH